MGFDPRQRRVSPSLPRPEENWAPHRLPCTVLPLTKASANNHDDRVGYPTDPPNFSYSTGNVPLSFVFAISPLPVSIHSEPL